MLVKRRKKQDRVCLILDKDLMIKQWMGKNFVALTSGESKVLRELVKRQKAYGQLTALQSLVDSQYLLRNWTVVMSLLDVIGIRLVGVSLETRINLLSTYLEELGDLKDAIRVCPN